MRIRHLNSERGDIEYIYDGDAVLEEVTNNTTDLVAHYRYADRLLSLNTPTDSQFYLFASLGTTANLADSSGNSAKAYRTDPYGEITHQEGTSINKQVFTGQEHDEQTGLIYFGARYYDPDIARFITQDTYLGEPNTAPSLHRYLYAYGNPTVWVDPTGNYNEGGHYYTTMIVAMRSGYTAEESAKIAMYTQIPDEVASYDAISITGRQALTKPLRLFKYQEGMHQLHGGSSEKATSAAVSVIRRADRNDFPRIGLANHPLGDSFSHRELGNEKVTYKAPLGHGTDGTDPDTIHLRLGMYLEYAKTLAVVLSEKNGMKITDEEIGKLQGDLWAAVDSSKVYEKDIRREYIPSVGWFMDIQYPDKVDDEATNTATISNLRKLAIEEYAKQAKISITEAEKQILKPEDHNLGIVHGFFRQGAGEEIYDIRNLLETKPSNGNWIKRWMNRDQEARGIWKGLDLTAEEVVEDIRENVK